MRTFWIQLMLVTASVRQGGASGTRHHSLSVLGTCVSGPSRFPGCFGVLMLDDLQVGYYNTTLDRVVTSSRDPTPLDLAPDAMRSLHDMLFSMRDRLAFFRLSPNQTKGHHVVQKQVVYQVQDGRPTFLLTRDAYSGQDDIRRMFNTTHFTYSAEDGWASHWTASRWTYLETLYRYLYFPTCGVLMKQLLDQKKDLVTRQVRPRMRIFSRQVKGGALLTCLATDFYPRHINLTLLRDGRPVEEDQLGPVLPNGNGLYQVRTTLELTEAELLQKHNYTCAAAHLGRGNGLSMMLRAPPQHTHRVHLVSPLFLLALVLLLLPVLVLAKCRKRKEPGTPRDSVEDESAAMVTPPSLSSRQEACPRWSPAQAAPPS